MPKLTLSTTDERRLEEAQEVLLSPLRYSHVDDWRSTVNASMKRLLGADMAAFGLSLGDGERIYSEDYDIAPRRRYISVLEPVAERTKCYERLRRLRVANRRLTFGRHLADVYRSAYYTDYIVPLRAYDSLTAVVETESGELAQLFFHHERPRGRRFGRRGLELLRLVYPAWVAGVEAATRLRKRRDGLARWIEALDEPLAILTADGSLEHLNPPFRRLLRREPERARVHTELAGMARAVALHGRNGSAGGDLGPPARRIRTRGGSYRARAVPGPPLGSRQLILVMVSAGPPPLPSPDALRRRHGLTARQAEVALLLGERRTNAEIANRLSVSEHTARRHTEKVLLKLGIHSRTEVRRAISEPDPRD